MNTLPPHELEKLQLMTNLNIQPVFSAEPRLTDYVKIPVSQIAAMGIGLEPLTELLSILTGPEGGSGMYWVSVKPGTHLAKFKDGRGFVGGFVEPGKGVVGQAVHTQLFDPTMLFMAATLMMMQQKLNIIQESQLEILDFLKQKEWSELKADLQFLNDIMANYQFNWNDSTYKAANYVKVLDIRQEAERKIDFCRNQIIARLNIKPSIHRDKKAHQQLDDLGELFERYQMAIYIYSFSYYLEVLLQENYDLNYLTGITDKIEAYSLQYRELYTQSYDRMERYLNSSVESGIRRKFSTVTKATGETIAKIPVISKSLLDETLISVGDKMIEKNEERFAGTMEKFIEKQSSYVRPFVESIEMVGKFYNEPLNMLVDGQYAYIGSGSD